MHCTCKTLLNGVFTASLTRSSTLPPSFLVPALAATQTSSFSTSPSHQKRKQRKDGNPMRGVSALHRTGLKQSRLAELSVSPENLPKPVLDPEKRSRIQVDDDHGLWDFFPADRKNMHTPEELDSHGREWTVPELRLKDWDDLHRLWWVCIKELNRMNTSKAERRRIGNVYGDAEDSGRRRAIRLTMKAIRHTLSERWYSWENARNAAMEDEEINMYADLDNNEQAYKPRADAVQETDAEAELTPDVTLPPPEMQQPSRDVRA